MYKSSILYNVSNRLKFDTFLLSYILLKMVSVVNQLHCHKKAVTSQKFSNDYGMIQLQNEQFANKTLLERECSTECSQKVFLKILQISLGNTCAK